MQGPVAVIVVSHNTRALLARALDSLEPEVSAGRAVVTVVDNASGDGSARQTAERHPWAGLVEPRANLGFGAAVNLGAAAHPDAGWIAPANADIELTPGALGALLAAAERDPAAAAFAPRLIHDDGQPQHSVHPFPSARLMLDFNLGRQHRDSAWGRARCLEGFWDPMVERRVPWAVGAFLLIRGPAWRRLGGFDPAMFLYAEDLDLGWRLARAGWATRYVPGAKVRHREAAAAGPAYGDQRTARWQAATYAWLARTHGPAAARRIAAINAAGACAGALDPRRPARERAALRHWARLHARCLRRPLT